MTKVIIWIREEDWPKWEAIEDKPSFIHDAIFDAFDREVAVHTGVPEISEADDPNEDESGIS